MQKRALNVLESDQSLGVVFVRTGSLGLDVDVSCAYTAGRPNAVSGRPNAVSGRPNAVSGRSKD